MLATTSRRTRLIGLWTSVILLVFVIYLVTKIFSGIEFKVTNTDPTVGNVAAISPYFKISFNKTLSGNGISISSSKGIVDSYSVQNKTITITLNTPLSVGANDYIKINKISDKSGNNIKNKTFNFTTLNTAYQDLPVDQQQIILKAQTQTKPSKSNISFSGTDALVSNGLSIGQVNSLEQDLFDYKPVAKKIVIDTSSVEPGARNPDVASPFTLNFSLTIDGLAFSAAAIYTNLTNLELVINNPQSNSQLYDSGMNNIQN
jgi:hypothetical protein